MSHSYKTFWVAMAYVGFDDEVNVISEPANGTDHEDAKLAVMEKYRLREERVYTSNVTPLPMVLQSLGNYTIGACNLNADLGRD